MAKIGEGSFGAWMRTGLDELRNAVYPESNVAQPQVSYGMFGHPTPGEVADSRRMEGHDLEDERPQGSTLERALERSAAMDAASHDPSMNRDTMDMDR